MKESEGRSQFAPSAFSSSNGAAGDVRNDDLPIEMSGDFYGTWLRLQCEAVAGASEGLLVLRQSSGKTYTAVAAWPGEVAQAVRLAEVAQHCLARGELVILDELVPGATRQRVLFARPIGVDAADLPLAAIVVAVDREFTSSADRERIARHLHWGSGWIEAMEWRRTLDQERIAQERSSGALDMVALAGEHRRLVGAAVGIVNELASRLGCGRVSLGIALDGPPKLIAISGSATFDRRSQVSRSVESAMEEAFHQARTIAEPRIDPDDHAITIAHRELAKGSGLPVVLSCVLPGRARCAGVIVLERDATQPLRAAEVRWMEAVSALLGPVLELQAEGERWIAGHGRTVVASWIGKLTGPEHPTFKLAVGAAVLLPLILLAVPGTFRVSAKSVVEGQIQRTLVAPFDGFVREASVRAGDVVHRNDVLARLDDRDAQLDLVRWQSETDTLAAKYADAMAQHDRPNVMMLAAQLRQAQAQRALAQDQLGRTRIVAPFDGVVVTGDLSQALGSPVERGKTLFEIAPLDRFRVIVQVDERDIRFVQTEQHGALVLAGMPSDPVPLHVTKMTPLSTSDEGRNYFRVEAALDAPAKGIRPGMEGIARVDIGRRPLLWIWTRSLIDWVRIALWRWLP